MSPNSIKSRAFELTLKFYFWLSTHLRKTAPAISCAVIVTPSGPPWPTSYYNKNTQRFLWLASGRCNPYAFNAKDLSLIKTKRLGYLLELFFPCAGYDGNNFVFPTICNIYFVLISDKHPMRQQMITVKNIYLIK